VCVRLSMMTNDPRPGFPHATCMAFPSFDTTGTPESARSTICTRVWSSSHAENLNKTKTTSAILLPAQFQPVFSVWDVWDGRRAPAPGRRPGPLRSSNHNHLSLNCFKTETSHPAARILSHADCSHSRGALRGNSAMMRSWTRDSGSLTPPAVQCDESPCGVRCAPGLVVVSRSIFCMLHHASAASC
jgi:hypothetical protein